MENLDHVKDYLNMELQARKSRNQYYSMRSFANCLNLSSGALSEILNGKRNLGMNKAHEVSERLRLEGEEKISFLRLVKKSQIKKSKTQMPKKQLKNSLEIYEFVSNPLFSFILSMADNENVELTPDYLSYKLGYSTHEIDFALARMVELGFIKYENETYIISNEVHIKPEDIPEQAMRTYHHEMMEKAKDALCSQAAENQEFNGITFSIDPRHMDKIREEIKKFQKSIIEKYQTVNSTELYHLETAFFRITKQ